MVPCSFDFQSWKDSLARPTTKLLETRREPEHRRRPEEERGQRSHRRSFGPAVAPATFPAACSQSSSRCVTWAWATTPTRWSASSTALGRARCNAPTTTWRWPTCCRAGTCPWPLWARCGTACPAAGPRTTRTWCSWTTPTAGTRWRSCQRPAALALDRQAEAPVKAQPRTLKLRTGWGVIFDMLSWLQVGLSFKPWTSPFADLCGLEMKTPSWGWCQW